MSSMMLIIVTFTAFKGSFQVKYLIKTHRSCNDSSVSFQGVFSCDIIEGPYVINVVYYSFVLSVSTLFWTRQPISRLGVEWFFFFHFFFHRFRSGLPNSYGSYVPLNYIYFSQLMLDIPYTRHYNHSWFETAFDYKPRILLYMNFLV